MGELRVVLSARFARENPNCTSMFCAPLLLCLITFMFFLLDPSVTLAQITRGLKGVTARQANEILGRTGKQFWQDETFDHWIRSGKQLERVHAYIERNPVTAGLARTPEEWPWSSASGRTGTLACP
jgi:hypothetical protein